MTEADAVWQSWVKKKEAALAFMKAAREMNSSVLIEIAAQHPLVHGRNPNAEFKARLDRGKELYVHYRSLSLPVEIYVPGSRHVFEGHEDEISLSEAGLTYLRREGLEGDELHGDDLNARYKGSAGVYGSADECFVAASYFRDSKFGTLASVLAPAQVTRKTLHYIAFGVMPLCFTVPTLDGYHDILYEAFHSIPRVLAVDQTLQEANSEDAKALRQKRRPNRL